MRVTDSPQERASVRLQGHPPGRRSAGILVKRCFDIRAGIATGYASHATLASDVPDPACAVNQIQQFATELMDPVDPAEEKRLALKHLMHYVRNVHQHPYAPDNSDKGERLLAAWIR